jgi:hypothetical protein
MVDFEQTLSPRAFDGYVKTIKQIAQQDATSIKQSCCPIDLLIRTTYLVAFNRTRAGLSLPPERDLLQPITRIAELLGWPGLGEAKILFESLYEDQRQGAYPELTLEALATPMLLFTSPQIGLAAEISFFAKLVDGLQQDLSVDSVTFLSTSARAIDGLFQKCFFLDGYLFEAHREQAVYHIARALEVISSSPSIVEKIEYIVENLRKRHAKLSVLTREMAKVDLQQQIDTLDGKLESDKD